LIQHVRSRSEHGLGLADACAACEQHAHVARGNQLVDKTNEVRLQLVGGIDERKVRGHGRRHRSRCRAHACRERGRRVCAVIWVVEDFIKVFDRF
jgi:hypothetical protein